MLCLILWIPCLINEPPFCSFCTWVGTLLMPHSEFLVAYQKKNERNESSHFYFLVHFMLRFTYLGLVGLDRLMRQPSSLFVRHFDLVLN